MGVDLGQRASIKEQHPCAIWLTGLSGAGKSTIANLLEISLHRSGHHTYVLDGDNLRHGLNSDLGFDPPSRVENMRRITEVAGLLVDAGLIVIVSSISPFRLDRERARSALSRRAPFVEVFVDVPLAVAESRDPKSLYRRARAGELSHFTGLGSAYEAPLNPELHIDGVHLSPMQAVQAIRQITDPMTGVVARP
jgi:bifunctional enzyme CysN/CysC